MAEKEKPTKRERPASKPGVKTFLLRLDPATMDAVERWAADEFRSVNGQLQWIISEALKKARRR